MVPRTPFASLSSLADRYARVKSNSKVTMPRRFLSVVVKGLYILERPDVFPRLALPHLGYEVNVPADSNKQHMQLYN
jgi:hypothetical protein